jgi:hypothetical protein
MESSGRTQRGHSPSDRLRKNKMGIRQNYPGPRKRRTPGHFGRKLDARGRRSQPCRALVATGPYSRLRIRSSGGLEPASVWWAPIRLATDAASASRVCSSVIVRILTGRPSCVRSWRKSIAQTWSGISMPLGSLARPTDSLHYHVGSGSRPIQDRVPPTRGGLGGGSST